MLKKFFWLFKGKFFSTLEHMTVDICKMKYTSNVTGCRRNVDIRIKSLVLVERNEEWKEIRRIALQMFLSSENQVNLNNLELQKSINDLGKADA